MNTFNSRKTLSVYPYIKELEYASNIDTTELNKILNSIEESSLRAILRSRELNTENTRLNLGVIKAYLAMTSHIQSLSYLNTTNSVASAYQVPSCATDDLNYDNIFGQVTLNQVGSYSKIPRGSNYSGKVSPNVTVYLDGTEKSNDDIIYDALDGTNKTFWIQEVSPNTLHTIRIDLPPTLTKRFNYIELFPFPLYGMSITDIRYTDLFGVTRKVTEGLYGYNPIINNSGEPIKLYLSPKEYDGTIYIDVKSTSLGVIGFSNIDIKFIDFDNNPRLGFLKFDSLSSLKNSGGTTNSIKISNPSVDFYMDGDNVQSMITMDASPVRAWIKSGTYDSTTNNIIVGTNGVNQQINIANSNTMIWNSTISLQTSEDLWFVFELQEHNVTTPVIQGCKIGFEGV